MLLISLLEVFRFVLLWGEVRYKNIADIVASRKVRKIRKLSRSNAPKSYDASYQILNYKNQFRVTTVYD